MLRFLILRDGVNVSNPSSFNMLRRRWSEMGRSGVGAWHLHCGTKATTFSWPRCLKWLITRLIPRHENILPFPWLKHNIRAKLKFRICLPHLCAIGSPSLKLFTRVLLTDWLIDWLTNWLTDWGLMALSAQIGYIVPLISMLQLKKWN